MDETINVWLPRITCLVVLIFVTWVIPLRIRRLGEQVEAVQREVNELRRGVRTTKELVETVRKGLPSERSVRDIRLGVEWLVIDMPPKLGAFIKSLLRGQSTAASKHAPEFDRTDTNRDVTYDVTLVLNTKDLAGSVHDNARRRGNDWERQIKLIWQHLWSIRSTSSDYRAEWDLLSRMYELLVDRWSEVPHPADDSAYWTDPYTLESLDLLLHQPPTAPKITQASDDEHREQLERLQTLITQAQVARRAELQGWGVERIEGQPGLTRQIPAVLERDLSSPPQQTDREELNETFCRIIPGHGGYKYRHNDRPLRKSLAVFYHYVPADSGTTYARKPHLAKK